MRVTTHCLAIVLCITIMACKSGCAHETPSPKNGVHAMERRMGALPGTEGFDPDLERKLMKAFSDQGSEYKPRTHHLNEDGSPKYINRLILETSPYLLQHAHNPVNWFSWGAEAFETARKLKRPILLSVGYSTCHWCHVMEVESFEDEEIAGYINAHYVPIKVDREERPDVDNVYMTAVQMMNRGGGGWPMTVVMTPDGRPFFGGTYFPPRDGARGARIGFLTILQRLNEAFTTEADKVLESARQVSEILQAGAKSAPPQGIPGPEALGAAARQLAARFDPEHGGFNGAPKFPRPSTYELLLRYWRRTQDDAALQIVTTSLRAMIDGGIYDQIAGGFHRYSTDERWLVPHFEKMLYDNAQLVWLLLDTHQATRDRRFAAAARETLDYVLREMTGPEGGFYSATDADSEGEEGLFFVWKPEEILAVLGEQRGRLVTTYYDVTPSGNFEGRNILHRPRLDAEVARQLGIEQEELERQLAEAKKLLYEAREKRVHPLRDDKILTEWNGQMISAFARGGFVLNEPKYLEAAKKAASFVLESSRAGGRLLRANRAGRARHGAVLEDYAFFIAGLIDLYESAGELRWLEEALALERTLEKHYLDSKDGAFFSTPDDGEQLLVREKPSYDGAQPSGNSIAVMNVLRLSELTGDEAYRRIGEKALQALGASLERGALECPKLAGALDFVHDKPKQVIIVTTKDDRGLPLLDVVRRTYLPNSVLVVTEDGAALERLQRVIPLVENKRAIGGKATAFVCTERVCQAPTSSPEALAKELAIIERLPLDRKLVLPH